MILNGVKSLFVALKMLAYTGRHDMIKQVMKA